MMRKDRIRMVMNESVSYRVGRKCFLPRAVGAGCWPASFPHALHLYSASKYASPATFPTKESLVKVQSDISNDPVEMFCSHKQIYNYGFQVCDKNRVCERSFWLEQSRFSRFFIFFEVMFM